MLDLLLGIKKTGRKSRRGGSAILCLSICVGWYLGIQCHVSTHSPVSWWPYCINSRIGSSSISLKIASTRTHGGGHAKSLADIFHAVAPSCYTGIYDALTETKSSVPQEHNANSLNSIAFPRIPAHELASPSPASRCLLFVAKHLSTTQNSGVMAYFPDRLLRSIEKKLNAEWS